MPCIGIPKSVLRICFSTYCYSCCACSWFLHQFDLKTTSYWKSPFIKLCNKRVDTLICQWRPLLHVKCCQAILFIYCFSVIGTCEQVCKDALWPPGKGNRQEILFLALLLIYCITINELLPLLNDCSKRLCVDCHGTCMYSTPSSGHHSSLPVPLPCLYKCLLVFSPLLQIQLKEKTIPG